MKKYGKPGRDHNTSTGEVIEVEYKGILKKGITYGLTELSASIRGITGPPRFRPFRR